MSFTHSLGNGLSQRSPSRHISRMTLQIKLQMVLPYVNFRSYKVDSSYASSNMLKRIAMWRFEFYKRVVTYPRSWILSCWKFISTSAVDPNVKFKSTPLSSCLSRAEMVYGFCAAIGCPLDGATELNGSPCCNFWKFPPVYPFNQSWWTTVRFDHTRWHIHPH